jgi:thiosulfate reductase cytochrome b subunit
LPVAAPFLAETPRHTLLVRLTHWLSSLLFLALLISGIELIISHPRFYWGETGNVNIAPLFSIPVPASRPTVPTGYAYVLPDQNGWSRYLHFQAAWFVVFTGLLYGLASLRNGHFRDNLLPARKDLSWAALSNSIREHLRFQRFPAPSYNLLQRLAYLGVVFLLFPLMIWTGLAMSPSFTSAFPATVTMLGGQQSARTLHFFITVLLVLFVLVHVFMVYLSGFRSRVRAMTLGPKTIEMENS